MLEALIFLESLTAVIMIMVQIHSQMLETSVLILRQLIISYSVYVQSTVMLEALIFKTA